jgi:hypothetical protein
MKIKSKIANVLVGSLVRIALVLMISLRPIGARAATFDIPDGDAAGLIAAINVANGNGEADTINLATSGTYTLTTVDNSTYWTGPTGLPPITSQIAINGNGATIQRSDAPGTPDFRIFYIDGSGDLTLSGVTIRGGKAAEGATGYIGGGGGLRNAGKLKLIKSIVTENGAAASGYYNDAGGIFNFCGTLIVENSTISNNTGFGGYGGGGILNHAYSPAPSPQNCLSTVAIINSSIFENRADGPTGFQGRGDAIADAFSLPGSVILKNSIVASPTQGLAIDCYTAAGVLGSLGHNIASDASCGLTGIGDLNSTDPLLGSLANNGGPTPTHAPLLGSPAINAVPLADCADANGNPIATDQRGVARPQGPTCDIGAYELEAETEMTVAIDIKPGSYPNSINPRSKGVIPVAIITTGTFDAAAVDPTTVLFGPTGTEAPPAHSALADADGDGDIDMILHFNTHATGIVCGDTSASLAGKTFGGQAVKGSDSIRTVGCKKETHLPRHMHGMSSWRDR